MNNKTLEDCLISIELKKVIDIIDNEDYGFEYIIAPDNTLILAEEWDEAVDNYRDDELLYIFDIKYASPLLEYEISNYGILDIFREHLLLNHNIYNIFKNYYDNLDKKAFYPKHLHLILELQYNCHQGYYDVYPDCELVISLYGQLTKDYKIKKL